jgi:hypothetical protein
MRLALAWLAVVLMASALACGRAGPPVRSRPAPPAAADTPDATAPESVVPEDAEPDDGQEETAP